MLVSRRTRSRSAATTDDESIPLLLRIDPAVQRRRARARRPRRCRAPRRSAPRRRRRARRRRPTRRADRRDRRPGLRQPHLAALAARDRQQQAPFAADQRRRALDLPDRCRAPARGRPSTRPAPRRRRRRPRSAAPPRPAPGRRQCRTSAGQAEERGAEAPEAKPEQRQPGVRLVLIVPVATAMAASSPPACTSASWPAPKTTRRSAPRRTATNRRRQRPRGTPGPRIIAANRGRAYRMTANGHPHPDRRRRGRRARHVHRERACRRRRTRRWRLPSRPRCARKGALTLPALTEAVGLKGFSARGKVILALNDMVAQGKVRTIPAPDGTPQLQKVNFIKYRARGVAARSLTLRRRRARRGASPCRRPPPASCCRSCRCRSAVGRRGAGRLRLAHGRLERVGLVGALPVEVGVGAAEVTVGGGLLVDRAQQVELLDQRARTAVERRAHRLRRGCPRTTVPVPNVCTSSDTGSATPIA